MHERTNEKFARCRTSFSAANEFSRFGVYSFNKSARSIGAFGTFPNGLTSDSRLRELQSTRAAAIKSSGRQTAGNVATSWENDRRRTRDEVMVSGSQMRERKGGGNNGTSTTTVAY